MVLGILALQLVRLTAADDAGDLSRLDADVLTKEQRSDAAGMIDRDIERRAAEVNARHRMNGPRSKPARSGRVIVTSGLRGSGDRWATTPCRPPS
jgi:hypothetical protein